MYYYNIYYPLIFATKNSRFKRAICAKEMPFGHSGSQTPVFEQFPKPSSSGSTIIFFARRVASSLYEIKKTAE